MTRSIAMPKLKMIVQELQTDKSYKEIARLASVSKALIGKIAKKLQNLEQSNHSQLLALDDQTLQELIYPPRSIKPNEPNWNHVHALMSKDRVTIDTVYRDDYLSSLPEQCEPMAYGRGMQKRNFDSELKSLNDKPSNQASICKATSSPKLNGVF